MTIEHIRERFETSIEVKRRGLELLPPVIEQASIRLADALANEALQSPLPLPVISKQ